MKLLCHPDKSILIEVHNGNALKVIENTAAFPHKKSLNLYPEIQTPQ
jgi:hypothetical protein